jgi:hypothetical protein
MSDILIIDDVVNKSLQNKIESEIFNPADGVPWKYRPTSTYNGESTLNLPILENQIDTFQFIHHVFDKGQPVSDYFQLFEPIILNLPINVKSILRIKLNLKLSNLESNEFTHCPPHVDYINIPRLVSAIYYVNDSTGDTILFNEKIDKVQNKLTIRQRVEPKKGRIVLFDGKIIHSSNDPKDKDPRVVANFNFII